MCKHIMVKSRFIDELWVLQSSHTTLSCTVSEILSIISKNLKTSRERDHAHSSDSL